MVIRVRAEAGEALGRWGFEHGAWAGWGVERLGWPRSEGLGWPRDRANRASRNGREGRVEGTCGSVRAGCKRWATSLVWNTDGSTVLDMLFKRAVNLTELPSAVPASRTLLLAAHVPLDRVHILRRVHGVAVRVALVVAEQNVAARTRDVWLETHVALEKGFAYLWVLLEVALALVGPREVFVPLLAVPAALLGMRARDGVVHFGHSWGGAGARELEGCEVLVLVREPGVYCLVATEGTELAKQGQVLHVMDIPDGNGMRSIADFACDEVEFLDVVQHGQWRGGGGGDCVGAAWCEDREDFGIIACALSFVSGFVRLVVQEDAFALLAVDCVTLEEVTTHVLVVVELFLRVRLVAELAFNNLFGLILGVAWPYQVCPGVEGVLVRQVETKNRVFRKRTLLVNASKYSTEVFESVVLV